MSIQGLIAEQRYCKTTGETRALAFDMGPTLDSGELCNGTPTVVEVRTSDLTIGSVAVSTAELTINGETVAIGEAVQCTVAAGLAGRSYLLKVTSTTDGSQTIEAFAWLDVVDSAA